MSFFFACMVILRKVGVRIEGKSKVQNSRTMEASLGGCQIWAIITEKEIKWRGPKIKVIGEVIGSWFKRDAIE